MQQRKRKYLISILIIGSIIALSVKDTFEVLHSILHTIPNPFHHHEINGIANFHHHENNPKKSFFNYAQHSHSLEDHLDSITKNPQKASSEKKKADKNGQKKLQKTNLYSEELHSICFYFSFRNKFKKPHDDVFFSSFRISPPTPPPQKLVS